MDLPVINVSDLCTRRLVLNVADIASLIYLRVDGTNIDQL